MEIIKLEDVLGTKFPAGRHTRVLIGPGSKEAKNFVIGYVVIYPGGRVPLHSHEKEEVYTILQGTGIMEVGEEAKEITAVSSVYVPCSVPHSLTNKGERDIVMTFVYSPAGLVDHWMEESEGRLR